MRQARSYVSTRSNAQVTAAIFDAIRINEVWLPSLAAKTEPDDRAAVCELASPFDGAHLTEGTRLIDGAHLPAGTRLIIRRDPLHSGAQRSLFPSLELRCWSFSTGQAGDPRGLDVAMGAHTRAEQNSTSAD